MFDGQSEKIKWGLRVLLNKPFFGKIGHMCYMGKPCYLSRKKDLILGDKVRIYPGIRTETQNGGKIIIGNLRFIIRMIDESSSHSRCVSKRESDPQLQE